MSEGTDIPRLQVCCHLSRVKTELYFRQVLGRILRVSSPPNQEAWLFTLAEEKLSAFANRIDQELPDLCILVRSNVIADDFVVTEKNKNSPTTSADINPTPMMELLDVFSSSDLLNKPNYPNKSSPVPACLEAFGGFRQKLIQTFACV